MGISLTFFLHENILESGKRFFKDILDINVAPATTSEIKIREFIKDYLTDEKLLDKIADARFIGLINDLSIGGKKQKKDVESVLKNPAGDYDMLLVFGIEMRPGIVPTKSDISRLTRALNKRSYNRPVVLLIKYSGLLSFSAAERGEYRKKGQKGEKIGRISILRDIDLGNVHSGHERILIQLRINPLIVTSFKDLYNQWLNVFNISILNKEFYSELFTWYLWAVRSVSFPNKVNDERDDTVYNSENVIRLLTRLIFIWFVKEKKLIPENLFDRNFLPGVLQKFNPEAANNSDFYKAILQNLFFATLNTEMPKDGGKRQFLDESKKNQNTGFTEEYMDHLSYRYKELFNDPQKALKLFENIPFLNGGLFECLDSRDPETNEEIRIDGFSSKPKKQPTVPNVLFFGHNDELDLSSEFEEGKKHKHSKARGIINILNSYKFTIEENTPLEQEIALDPELLGKIFENLLASFNPETKTTARKQTGSYYTPREIVNYMVDESLIAYLKTKLTEKSQAFQQLGNSQTNMFGNEFKAGQLDMQIDLAANKWTGKEEALETKLRELLVYEKEGNPFSDDKETTDAIIVHLSECKILDPACGSGAFPMGILHKMVFALGKLDPCNYTWKQAQLDKALRDRQRAELFEDETLRNEAITAADEKIHYIEDSFGETGHELDYTRKLFLIENCIYGVDIQQIAVQISKLRFFISLMVDQRVDDTRPNRNVLSLPNLETKFVAANTLIPVDKPQQLLLKDPELEKTEKELHEIHHRIFFTRSYSDKKALKNKELATRKFLRKLYIEKAGYSKEAAEEITRWNPFDPLTAAPFFDPEVMFSIESINESCFDILIGNPPYGVINKKQNKAEGIQASIKELEFYKNSLYYLPATGGMLNIFRLFILKSIYLLKPNGIFSEIFPLAFTGDTSVSKLRNFILNKKQILFIEAFPERDNPQKRVFEVAKMSVCIMVAQNSNSYFDFFIRINRERRIELQNEKNYLSINNIRLLDENGFTIPLCSKQETDILIKVYSNSKRIRDIGHCSTGEADMTFCRSFFTENPRDSILLKGAIIDRYILRESMSQGEIKYLDETKFLSNHKNIDHTFKLQQRIVLQGITGINERIRLKAMIISNAYCANSVNYLSGLTDVNIYYLLGLLNSKLLNFIFKIFSTNSNVNGYEVDNLPLPKNTKHSIEKTIIISVKKILKKNSSIEEFRIDILVYKLFFLKYYECKIIDPGVENLISRDDYEKATVDELAEWEFKK